MKDSIGNYKGVPIEGMDKNGLIEVIKHLANETEHYRNKYRNLMAVSDPITILKAEKPEFHMNQLK